jgi:trehalose-phosphatase
MDPSYYFEADPLRTKAGADVPIALFLDFDGTLVPIANDPGLPRLSPESRQLLASILECGAALIAFVSGRGLRDLKRRVGVPGAYYAGSHGLEISGPEARFVHAGAVVARPAIDALCRDVKRAIDAWEGVTIEKKAYSFAVHYRNAAKGAGPFLHGLLGYEVASRPACREFATIVRGKKVLEVVPLVRWDKGRAALWIADRLRRACLPICIGDDSTDETLFEVFRESGVTIRVGRSRRTSAAYYLRSQGEVRLFLEQIRARKETGSVAGLPPFSR